MQLKHTRKHAMIPKSSSPEQCYVYAQPMNNDAKGLAAEALWHQNDGVGD